MGETDSTRSIPWQFDDAVKLWAREHGKANATIRWNAATKCAVIEFTLRNDDPRMRHWQEGRLKFEPKETVFLNKQVTDGKGKAYGPYVAIDLEQLGVSGLIDMLNEGDVQSGTGRYRDMQEAIHAIEGRNEQMRAKMREAAVENARLRARDMRRQVFDLPLVSVPENLEK